MKNILIGCASALLIGCASKEPVKYTAPSVVEVKTGIERLRPHVNSPEGTAAVNDLSAAVDNYEAQVNQQAKDLAKAQNDAVYWRGKHSAALRRLWFWRGMAAFALASLAGWLAIRLGYKYAL